MLFSDLLLVQNGEINTVFARVASVARLEFLLMNNMLETIKLPEEKDPLDTDDNALIADPPRGCTY